MQNVQSIETENIPLYLISTKSSQRTKKITIRSGIIVNCVRSKESNIQVKKNI